MSLTNATDRIILTCTKARFVVSSVLINKERTSVKHRYLLASLLFTNSCLAVADCVPLPPESPCVNRDRAIWEQPACPDSTGHPIILGRDYYETGNVIIKPYGYIKGEIFWDTRQTEGSREQQSMLFPKPFFPDLFGTDINSRGQWHATAVETRFGFALKGPTWGSVSTDGRVEGDFRGPLETANSAFRLRHAFCRVDWGSGSFLCGQWWHPLFILKCFPHTVAFAIGAPMEAQARDPQLRLTQRWRCFEAIFALAGQRDFQSNGPNGLSTEYIRNSAMPNIHFQTRAYWNDDAHMIGAAVDYKRLVPRIVTDKCVAENSAVGSIIFEAFASFLQPPWSLRLKAFWAENANDQFLISGFGVRTRDPITNCQTYSSTATAGAWLDFTYIFGCDDREFGFFVGGTKNLGSRDALFIDPETNLPIIFALTRFGPDIDYVVKFQPRFVYRKDPIRFGAELEYARASFGCPDECGRVRNGIPVDDFRILLALYYVF